MLNITPIQIWSLCTVALFMKMLATAMFQGQQRMKHKVFTKPEDAKAYGNGEAQTEELPSVDRAQRALRNDLENIPIFLFLGLAYIQLGCWSTGALIYMPVFVLARIGHTLFYIRPTQPHRTLSYSIGTLCLLVMCGHIVAQVFM